MTTLVIKTNASQTTDVLIADLGFFVPNSGGSITFTDLPNLQDCNTSVSLRSLATDDAYGVNNSTLILNNGLSDIPQNQVNNFLTLVGGRQGSTGFSAVGNTGIYGITGIQAINGITGLSGFTGFESSTGIRGNTGLDSIIGVTGLYGPTGLTSTATGVRGVTGFAPQGVTGLQGTTGLSDGTGLQGTSPSGFRPGASGLVGVTGITGVTGIAFKSQIKGATGLISTTNTAYPAFASTGVGFEMALIPAAGTYRVMFSTSVDQSGSGNDIFISIFSGGNQAVDSEVMFQQGTGTLRAWAGTQTFVTVDGTQIVDVRWRVSTGTGQMYEKNLLLIQILS